MYDLIQATLLKKILESQTEAINALHQIIASNSETFWTPFWKYHIPNLLQLLVILTGIGVAIYQVRKQREIDVEAQKEKIRTDLKLQLRQEIEEVVDQLNNLTAIAANYPASLSMSFTTVKAVIGIGGNPAPISQRFSQFNQMNADIQNAACELIRLIEKYEIVLPELKVFQTAVNVFSKDFRDACYGYGNLLLNILPMDVLEEHKLKTGLSVYNRPLPTPEQDAELKRLGEIYANTLNTFGGWLMDLRVALQNLALKPLFPDNMAKYREPLDPKVVVIRTDPDSLAKLTKYFEEETRWGKEKMVIEQQVKEFYCSNKDDA